jgi:hypothetical protein
VVGCLLNRRGARPGSVGAGECPAEPGELAGDGDRDERTALAALCVQSAPDVVQMLLGLPGDRQDVGGLAVLAALQRLHSWLANTEHCEPTNPDQADEELARNAEAR